MPEYLRYSSAVEKLEADEAETQAKIIEVMTDGMHNTRESMASPFGSLMPRRMGC